MGPWRLTANIYAWGWCMGLAERFDIIVASRDDSGTALFTKPPETRSIHVPDVVEGAYLWDTWGIPQLPSGLGGSAIERPFPEPGGARLGVFCFPARSAGKLDFTKFGGRSAAMEISATDDPAMHRTNSIDFEYIISGKIDLELPGGQCRTIEAGNIVIMGGVPHAWKNPYDTDCVYLAVIVGAQAPA